MKGRAISRITLLPINFHVTSRKPLAIRPTKTQLWQEQQGRRRAFIEAERLSPAECRHLPLAFDPAIAPARAP